MKGYPNGREFENKNSQENEIKINHASKNTMVWASLVMMPSKKFIGPPPGRNVRDKPRISRWYWKIIEVILGLEFQEKDARDRDKWK